MDGERALPHGLRKKPETSMRIVYHVGAHKTGSSLVQTYLRRSPHRRVASGAAVIPRHHTNELIGWGDIVLRQPDRLRRRIEAEARREPTVLTISHERTLGRPFEKNTSGLYPRASDVVEALARLSAGFETKVIMYVRPIADFVESYYLQTIHEGATHGFEAWLAGIDAESLAWGPVIDHLDEAFGRQAVEVGDFREIQSGQNLFLRNFLKRAEIAPWTTVRYRYRSNPSISSAGLEFALERNSVLNTIEERRAWRTYLQTHFSNLDGPRARPMPPDIHDRLTSMTAVEYELLTQRASDGISPRNKPLSR